MKNLKKILFPVVASLMILPNARASLNYDSNLEKDLRNVPRETQSLPYCNNLFRGLSESEKYLFLMNIIINLNNGNLDFVKVGKQDCKFKGLAVISQVPEGYSFEEVYELFITDYVEPWAKSNNR